MDSVPTKTKVAIGIQLVMGLLLFILALILRFWTIGFLVSLVTMAVAGIKIKDLLG